MKYDKISSNSGYAIESLYNFFCLVNNINNSTVFIDNKKKDFEEALGIETNEDYARLLFVLLELCDTSKKQMRLINKQSKNKRVDIIEKIKTDLCGFCYTKIQFDYKSFAQMFDKEILAKVEACVDFVKDELNIDVIEKVKLDTFVEEIDELKNELLNSKIDNSLKNIIITYLDSVNDAILKYDIYGVEGIKENVSVTMGILATIRYNVRTEETDIFERILKTLTDINTITCFGQTLIGIGIKAKEFLN